MKEEPPSVSTGIHTRNERAEYSVADERKETIRERMAWALDMLRLLRLKVRPCKRERFFLHASRVPPETPQSGRAKVKKTWDEIRKKQHSEEIASETSLLKVLYEALIAPVEEALKGVEEVLIVPHKELFEVPWAALIDAHGHFLIERHVLRVAPSLRVAQQAAVSAAQGSARRPGHIVLVGNPLPIRSGLRSLPYAQQEAQGVHDSLKRANVLVKPEHFFMSDSYPKATKANVKKSLEDAGWAHLALHGDADPGHRVSA